jgi:hypothetical protein
MLVRFASSQWHLHAVALQVDHVLLALLPALSRLAVASLRVARWSTTIRHFNNCEIVSQLVANEPDLIPDTDLRGRSRTLAIETHMTAVHSGACCSPRLVETREPKPSVEPESAVNHDRSPFSS